MMDVTQFTLAESLMLELFLDHRGQAQGASCKQLTQDYNALVRRYRAGTEISERGFRLLIEQMRGKGWHCCAHPAHGYFVALTDQELQQTCAFLTSRALNSLRIVARIQRIALPDLLGQMRLKL